MRLLGLLCGVLAAVLLYQPVYAATGAWQGDAVARARLIAATTATGSSGVVQAGLEIELAEGWKTYWRSPGDAGLPPVLAFGGESNVKHHALQFPAPHRFSLFGLDTFGYDRRVIFPLTLTLADPTKPLVAVGQFSGLVCRTLCIPLDYELRLVLPSGESQPSQHAFDLAQAQAQVPSLATSGGVRVGEAVVQGNRLIVKLAGRDGEGVQFHHGSEVLVEAAAGVQFSAPRFVNGLAHLDISSASTPASALIGSQAIATVLADDFMLEEGITITAASSISIGGGLLVALLAGVLGGLVLNAMPCVLPVLAVKLAGVVGMGGAARRVIRRRFLMTALGIMVGFIGLAVILLAVRASGAALGWGVQFQNPVFLATLMVVMLGFALVLADFWVLPMPAFASRLAQASHRLTGDIKDMAAGGLAVVLATPCSAPFLGVAVAFAFVASPVEMVLVFVAMGVGLASPWLVVAARPHWVSVLPKPGRWLLAVKQVLAGGLVATAVWLGFVLAQVVGEAMPNSAGDGDWQVWQAGAAENLVADGRVVLVDVTADWCLTCQANKLLVLDTPATQNLIDQFRAVALKADWTRQDDTILAYLGEFDRYGIPFNVVYGPGAPEGIVLPELLTHASLADALTQASKL